MNKEVEARYKSLLATAYQLLLQPPYAPKKEEWLAAYRELLNEQRRVTQQLSLWEGEHADGNK